MNKIVSIDAWIRRYTWMNIPIAFRQRVQSTPLSHLFQLATLLRAVTRSRSRSGTTGDALIAHSWQFIRPSYAPSHSTSVAKEFAVGPFQKPRPEPFIRWCLYFILFKKKILFLFSIITDVMNWQLIHIEISYILLIMEIVRQTRLGGRSADRWNWRPGHLATRNSWYDMRR